MTDKIEKAKKELESGRIAVGMATCGISAGAQPVYEKLKKSKLQLPVTKVGCNGMCYNEPIVTVVHNKKKYIYGNVTEENIDILIESIKKGIKCKELFLANELDELQYYKKQKRLIMENCGHISPTNINQYMATGGYTGLYKALETGAEGTINTIKDSGLRGRGGAGFPTGLKWQFMAAEKGKKYLIGNGDEGDPGAFMNRTLMESDPFRIIEGITIAAFATGAEEGFIYTRAEYPLAISTLQEAINIAYKKNLLGKNINGKKGFNFELSIRKGAGAFVCGEETALIHSIEGKRGSPTPRPPFPAQKGVFNQPSTVNNVGTLGHVATIMKIGHEKYKKIGTKKNPGTKVVCLTGKIARSGIVEIPMGTRLKDIVYEIGGGTPKGTRFKAILTGGPSGGCIPASKLNETYGYETMQKLGSIMGSGGIVVLSNQSCMPDIARYFMNFTQEESCGKCTPCREGNKRILEILNRITSGKSSKEEFEKLKKLAEFVRDNSLCGLGMGAPNPVLSTINFFENEYKKHVNNKKCPAGVCVNMLQFTITEKCIGCGACKKVCPVNAIEGSPKNMHTIHQDTCTRCGSCHEICPVNAIDKK